MKRNLVLLTKTYPYDTGEEFIENEIPLLSKQFDNVTIIATACKSDSVLTRKAPENVKCFKILSENNTIKRYIFCIFRGMTLLKEKTVKQEINSVREIKKKLSVLYIAGRVKRILQQIYARSDIREEINRPDTVFYSYWFLDLPIVANKLKKENRFYETCISISRAHGYDLYEDRHRACYFPFRRKVLIEIDMVFPCSENGSKYLKRKYPEYKEKIQTSYLGTDDYGMTKSTTRDVFQIATCSSLVPLKRLEILAEALLILEKNFERKIIWHCIGDGPERRKLENITAKLKKNQAIFYGNVENKQVIEIYKRVAPDLFVNVSSTEGLPVSIMEAISLGIPVLATNVGGTNEIVKDNVTGKLISAEISADDLKDSIESVLSGSINHEKVRNFWSASFNSNKNYLDFIGILNEL